MDDLPVRIALYAVSVFFGAVSSSATRRMSPAVVGLPMWKLALGALSTIGILVIVVGGFFFIPWYAVLVTLPIAWMAGTIALVSLLGGPIRHENVGALFLLGWIADVLVVLGAALLVFYLVAG